LKGGSLGSWGKKSGGFKGSIPTVEPLEGGNDNLEQRLGTRKLEEKKEAKEKPRADQKWCNPRRRGSKTAKRWTNS